MRNLMFFILSILLFFTSCNPKKGDEPQIQTTVDTWSESKVLICNEGNFGWGNGSVSIYDKNDKSIVNEAFKATNDYGLGDVCQSAYYYNEKIYIVVNNSSKIEVVNQNDFKVNATIGGLTSPRYFLPVSNSKAYVTDLYADEISVVNLNSNLVTGTIKCNGWTEELVQSGDKVYVSNPEKQFVYVLNVNSDVISDSILVGLGVSSIQKDSLGLIWCLRSNEAPALLRINTDNSVSEFLLDAEANPSQLKYNVVSNSLYFIKGNICKFDIVSELFKDDFIINNDNVFYGLGVDQNNGDIYVSDAKNFVQKSKVYMYSINGSLINSFDSGINTGYFLFGN